MINGNRIKELRLNKNMTQEELGNILGITKASICCYEKGTRTPTIENLIDLATYFGVSADYIIGNDALVTTKNKKLKNYVMTKEEVKFIEELRKNKYVYGVLLEDPLRGVQLVEKKVG